MKKEDSKKPNQPNPDKTYDKEEDLGNLEKDDRFSEEFKIQIPNVGKIYKVKILDMLKKHVPFFELE